MKAIVKVQVPLFGGADPALVYAEGRKLMQTIPVTGELRRKMAGEPKAFFYAEWSKSTGWVLAGRAPYQEW